MLKLLLTFALAAPLVMAPTPVPAGNTWCEQYGCDWDTDVEDLSGDSIDPSRPPLVIPAVAVEQKSGEQFCFVVDSGDSTSGTSTLFRVRRTVVVALPIPTEPENLRVVSGLKKGDRVVVKGSRYLSDGAMVRIDE